MGRVPPGLDVSFDAEWSEENAGSVSTDRCFIFHGDPVGGFEAFAATDPAQEHNRPSAVCELARDRYGMAWTSFAGESVDVVSTAFSAAGIS